MTSQAPHVCFEAPVFLGMEGRKILLPLPPFCLDFWLPSEARQCREMFAPKQLRCFGNCLALLRKAKSCSSTLLPPLLRGPETKANGAAQQRGHESKGGHRHPRCGERRVQGSSVSRDWSFPSCPDQKGSFVPDCRTYKSQIVNIYLESRRSG